MTNRRAFIKATASRAPAGALGPSRKGYRSESKISQQAKDFVSLVEEAGLSLFPRVETVSVEEYR